MGNKLRHVKNKCNIVLNLVKLNKLRVNFINAIKTLLNSNDNDGEDDASGDDDDNDG